MAVVDAMEEGQQSQEDVRAGVADDEDEDGNAGAGADDEDTRVRG